MTRDHSSEVSARDQSDSEPGRKMIKRKRGRPRKSEAPIPAPEQKTSLCELESKIDRMAEYLEESVGDILEDINEVSRQLVCVQSTINTLDLEPVENEICNRLDAISDDITKLKSQQQESRSILRRERRGASAIPQPRLQTSTRFRD